MQDVKHQTVQLLKSIETGDPTPARIIHERHYVQHNLSVCDGLQGFVDALKALPKNSAKVDTVRVFQDADFVFTHTNYNFFGPKIGFDVFRFEDGNIVEHWDNLQATPAKPNPSGHTMIDGPTEVRDCDKTQANKELVRSFVHDIFIKGHMDRLAEYFDGEHYIQHNPHIGDHLWGLPTALKTMSQAGIQILYERVHQVLGEGNFVLVISEGWLGAQHSCFYDLFRVQAGKIAEHWDVIESIAPVAEHKNNNGKFGF